MQIFNLRRSLRLTYPILRMTCKTHVLLQEAAEHASENLKLHQPRIEDAKEKPLLWGKKTDKKRVISLKARRNQKSLSRIQAKPAFASCSTYARSHNRFCD